MWVLKQRKGRNKMKLSTALRLSENHFKKGRELLDDFTKELQEALDDDTAAFIDQTDGMCIVYGNGKSNSCIDFMPNIDKLLKLSKKNILIELEQAAI
jgi:hypothetical protein